MHSGNTLIRTVQRTPRGDPITRGEPVFLPRYGSYMPTSKLKDKISRSAARFRNGTAEMECLVLGCPILALDLAPRTSSSENMLYTPGRVRVNFSPDRNLHFVLPVVRPGYLLEEPPARKRLSTKSPQTVGLLVAHSIREWHQTLVCYADLVCWLV